MFNKVFSYSRWLLITIHFATMGIATWSRMVLMPSKHRETIHYLQEQISKVHLDMQWSKHCGAKFTPWLTQLYTMRFGAPLMSACARGLKVPLILLYLPCDGFDVAICTIYVNNRRSTTFSQMMKMLRRNWWWSTEQTLPPRPHRSSSPAWADWFS